MIEPTANDESFNNNEGGEEEKADFRKNQTEIDPQWRCLSEKTINPETGYFLLEGFVPTKLLELLPKASEGPLVIRRGKKFVINSPRMADFWMGISGIYWHMLRGRVGSWQSYYKQEDVAEEIAYTSAACMAFVLIDWFKIIRDPDKVAVDVLKTAKRKATTSHHSPTNYLVRWVRGNLRAYEPQSPFTELATQHITSQELLEAYLQVNSGFQENRRGLQMRMKDAVRLAFEKHIDEGWVREEYHLPPNGNARGWSGIRFITPPGNKLSAPGQPVQPRAT